MDSMNNLDATVNYRMFEGIAKRAIRAGLKAEGRMINTDDLGAEVESLAYDLSEIARVRINELGFDASLR